MGLFVGGGDYYANGGGGEPTYCRPYNTGVSAPDVRCNSPVTPRQRYGFETAGMASTPAAPMNLISSFIDQPDCRRRKTINEIELTSNGSWHKIMAARRWRWDDQPLSERFRSDAGRNQFWLSPFRHGG